MANSNRCIEGLLVLLILLSEPVLLDPAKQHNLATCHEFHIIVYALLHGQQLIVRLNYLDRLFHLHVLGFCDVYGSYKYLCLSNPRLESFSVYFIQS